MGRWQSNRRYSAEIRVTVKPESHGGDLSGLNTANVIWTHTDIFNPCKPNEY